MRIIVTANTSFMLANFRSGLIRALNEDGFSLTALVPKDNHTGKLRKMGCTIYPLQLDRKGVSPHREVLLFVRFLWAFRKIRPIAVFSYTIKNNIYGALAARWTGIPFFPNVTGLGTSFKKTGILNWVVVTLYRWAWRHVTVAFFQNRDDAALFQKLKIIGRNKIIVLPGSGVNLSEFSPRPLPAGNGGPTFLMISRLLKEKGVIQFAEAAKYIKKNYPSTRFQILGPFDFGNRSCINIETVQYWVETGVVEYLGEVDDVRPVISKADCVVLPSYYREGVPRSLLEAAAMARPIVTTDTPGCRDVVEDGINGLLCRPRDWEDLAEKMMQIAAVDDERRGEMGRSGRRKIEREFDERMIVSAYRSALHGILNTICKENV